MLSAPVHVIVIDPDIETMKIHGVNYITIVSRIVQAKTDGFAGVKGQNQIMVRLGADASRDSDDYPTIKTIKENDAIRLKNTKFKIRKNVTCPRCKRANLAAELLQDAVSATGFVTH